MQHCPDAVGIFIAPPSMEVLEEGRLRRNTETEEDIARRLAHAAERNSMRCIATGSGWAVFCLCYSER